MAVALVVLAPAGASYLRFMMRTPMIITGITLLDLKITRVG